MQKLTKEDEQYIRDNLRYDPETGELWWTKPLQGRQINKPVGSNTGDGYLQLYLSVTSRVYNLKSHRVCWFLYYGSWPNSMLDHIDGDGTNNKVDNLRLVSNQENQMNKRAKVGCSSKYKGVHWCKQRERWRSRIKISGKFTFLGSYTSEEEAARAYDKAARETFGEYARLNFPEEHEQGAVNGLDA